MLAVAGFQLFADLQQFLNRNRRTRNRFLSFELTAFDSFRDRHFAFAREQRHHAHLAQVQTNRIVGFLQGAGGEIELNILVTDVFVIGRNGGSLLEQTFVGIGDWDV